MDTVTPPPSTPSQPLVAEAAVPSVDLHAPLKIESAPAEEKKGGYGEKLFIFGLLFCCIIVLCVAAVLFFWNQTANQVQKPVTIEQQK